MENTIITTQDYFGNGLNRLNPEAFSNLPKKVISKAEFQLEYLQKGVPIITGANVKQFILDAQEKLQKAKEEDETINLNDLEKGIVDQLSNLEEIHIQKSDIETMVFYTIKQPTPDADLEKGEGKNDKDSLEKSDVSRTLTGYYGGKDEVTFQKTGKEIAEKVTAKIALLDAAITPLETKAADLITAVGVKPTESVPDYYYGNMTHLKAQKSLSRYPYSFCYFNAEKGNGKVEVYESEPGLDEEIKRASSKEMADACGQYNNAVEQLASMYCDKEALEFWKRNIEDNKKYMLNAQMCFLLGF